mmetsp:Transcript_30408/g.40431  ORF Transcript_30408/g.40431 Transcript_30408/m.40431 type:complete len:194 (+) Transcript_30408:117-698(+)
MMGPDDRASLLSSITNGPQVEMQHGVKGSGKDQEIRIGMVGNEGVGKTSLLRRFVKGELQDEGTVVSTLGYDDSLELKVKINGESFKIKFGDTAGQERYFNLTKSYFQMHDALVVVFDMTNPNTLEGAMRWIKQIKEVKELPLILVGNKAELEEYRILSDELFNSIHESTEIPCIQTSAYTGMLVEDAFTLVI